VHRSVSLNRAQTTLEPDGSFRMVIAHRDPGVLAQHASRML